jgi:hypothetical protein
MSDQPDAEWWRSPASLSICSLLIIMGFYLLMEHTAHVLGALPYLLLLLCPVLHLFHHRGHRHHTHRGSSASPPQPGA